jgi:hypothetical protein
MPVLLPTHEGFRRRNYTNRAEQRQMYASLDLSRSQVLNPLSGDHFPSIRILYMPAVFAIISFFSYRFYRNYTYYALVPVGAHVVSFLSSAHD